MRRRAAVLIPGDGKRGMSLPSCGCFDEVLWVVHVEVPLNGRDLPSRGEESNFPRAENACGVFAAPRVRTLSPPTYQLLVLGMLGTLCGHYMRVLEERGMLRKPEKLSGPPRSGRRNAFRQNCVSSYISCSEYSGTNSPDMRS